MIDVDSTTEAAILAMVAAHGVHAADYDPTRPPLAALDWDDTCMHGDISHEALDQLEAADPRGRVDAYRAACAEDLFAGYRGLVHTLLVGKTLEEARAMAEQALTAGSAAGRIALRPAMGRIITALHAEGWRVRVVTASPAPLVQAVARGFGVPPDHVLGVRSVERGGRFVAELIEPVTMGPGKLTALRAAMGYDPLFAAGDSRSDLPMLDVARYGLWFDRGDPALSDHARQRGWWIVPSEGA